MVRTTCRQSWTVACAKLHELNSATSGALVAGETAVGSSICILPTAGCDGTPGRPPSDLAWRPANGDATVFEPDARCAGFNDSLAAFVRSEEHTSELQSLRHLVC